MRVGKDNKWGYSFKNDSGISFEQEAVLGTHLARFDGEYCHFVHSMYQPESTRHYLPEDIKSVLGIGPKEESKSVGIVWSMKEIQSLEALYYTGIDIEYDFYPYKVRPDKRYYVQDGEVYEQ